MEVLTNQKMMKNCQNGYENVSLDFKDFRIFIAKRKELLTTTIKAIVGEKQ